MRGKFFIAAKVGRLPSRNFARFPRSRREFRRASYDFVRITFYPSLLLCRISVFSNKVPHGFMLRVTTFLPFLVRALSLSLSAACTIVGPSVSRENYVSSTMAYFYRTLEAAPRNQFTETFLMPLSLRG